MKVSEFHKAIHVSGPGYYRFMKQNGPEKGAGCEAYVSAMRFFQRRERNGHRISSSTGNGMATGMGAGTAVPQKRFKIGHGSSSFQHMAPKPAPSIASASTLNLPQQQLQPSLKPSGPASVTSHTSSTPAPSAFPPPQPHVGDSVILPGFNTENVPVYDNCDVIRARVSSYLQQPGITQASFLRTLKEQYPETKRNIQSVQLSRFRSMLGPEQGTNNPVYYSAYVFFERARVAEGVPKGEERLRMEMLFPQGVDVEKRRIESVRERKK